VPQRIASPEFIGRGPELSALLDALHSAVEHRFSAVFVAGESGVGKSRLLHELEREAESRGARVLAGECFTLAEGELPYAPIRSVLRRLERDLDPGVFDDLLGPGRDELARLLPQPRAPAAREPDPALSREPLARSRMFELLLALLTRLAAQAPIVLLIEDVHWADRSTLDLLAFLVTNARREALLLVCSYRTDELHRRHPLRAFLAQHERPPMVQRIDLPRFTPQELAAQLHAILGTAPDPALVTRLHARTEGNAFFTEEVLAASREGIALPVSLRDALMLRIDVLPEAAQHMVRLIAVHGRPATHRLLAAAGALPEDELHGALREALARQVLVQRADHTYALRHALFAEALDADLLPGERTSLHLALAEAIDREPTLVDRNGRAAAELSAHWLGAHRLPEALAAAVRAAGEAEQVYAFAEASDHFLRALELWDRIDDAAQRAGMDEGALHARAAEAAHLGGDGPGGIRLVRAAIEKVDPGSDRYRAAVLRGRLGHYLFVVSGDVEGAQSALEEAVDLLPGDEPRHELARVLATLGQMLMLRGRTDESLERCEQALAVARKAGAPSEEAHALNTLGVNLGLLGDREAGIKHLRESLRVNEELGDPDGLVRAYGNLSEILDEDGEVEEAARVAADGARRAAELGMRDWGHLLEGEAATRLLMLGRLDEADAVTRPALDLPPSLAKLVQCAARACIEIQRGRIAEAELLLDAAHDATPFAPGPTWIEPLASARVEFELLRGRPEEALLLTERALERGGDHEYVAFTARLHALGARAGAMLAERARAAGDNPAAADAAASAEALVDRIGRLIEPGERWRGPPPPEVLAYRDVCAAETARAAGSVAASVWSACADRWAGLGRPLEEAYARLREAECLLFEGDRRRAEAVSATGLRMARACGAAWLEAQIASLARRGRLTLPDDPLTGAAPVVDEAVERLALTERELAVLELVAVGKTNREIGEQLFMAGKTVSVHVSRILTKLGVSSRVEAATAAQRLGLVP
jgi:DNA-binding CsgD family transcriptional regulator/tetratricopeptide (TPR) repeat protein